TYHLREWDPSTGKERWHTDQPQTWVQGMTYCRDGKVLAALEQTGAVALYEAAGGHELRRFGTGPANGNAAVMGFSPDDRLLAVAAYDFNAKATHVRVYEVASSTVRHDFAGHSGQVAALAFSADGKRVATGASDTTVLLWDLTGAADADVAKAKPGAEEL